MNFSKFGPVFAPASPLAYLSPTYLVVVIINEVNEKMEEECKQQASTDIKEA